MATVIFLNRKLEIICAPGSWIRAVIAFTFRDFIVFDLSRTMKIFQITILVIYDKQTQSLRMV